MLRRGGVGARLVGALPGCRLAPDATLTQIVAEIGTAIDWLAWNGPAYGIAGGPIVVSGWSAGGHLAAMALDHPRVAAGLTISGVFDLAPLRDTYLNERLRLIDSEIWELSPMRLPVVAKPLVISYGTAELPALVRTAAISTRDGGLQVHPDRWFRFERPTISLCWRSYAGRTECWCARS
jgi:acetyl esterase/lipase